VCELPPIYLLFVGVAFHRSAAGSTPIADDISSCCDNHLLLGSLRLALALALEPEPRCLDERVQLGKRHCRHVGAVLVDQVVLRVVHVGGRGPARDAARAGGVGGRVSVRGGDQSGRQGTRGEQARVRARACSAYGTCVRATHKSTVTAWYSPGLTTS
jgi:hypothetical protein